MERPDPDPYGSYSSHASSKPKRKKSKNRRHSQSSNSEATGPDAAERSQEGSRPMKDPSAGTAGTRDGGSHKRKRRRSSASQRSMASNEARSSAVTLDGTTQQGTAQPTDVPAPSIAEKGLPGDSKPAQEVVPWTGKHGAQAKPVADMATGAAGAPTAMKDQHAGSKVSVKKDSAGQPPHDMSAKKGQVLDGGVAVAPDKMTQPGALQPAIVMKEVVKAAPSRAGAPVSDADMGAADEESRQRLFGAAALSVLALSAMGAVLVLMFLLQAWDKEVRLNVPNLGVFLGTRGFVENSPVYIFRAIPFARGTSGHQRFSVATAATKNVDAEIDARMSQPGCIQMPYMANGKVLRHNEETSEECLHLNIWTPCTEDTQAGCRKTVLVFFHSIEFQTGDNNYYDGQWLSGLGRLVVVSPNFRLGAFGFLKFGCPRTDIPCAPGDVSLYDQRLALEWVVAHIASFGGNASDVVLMGSAAGAWSVGAHLLTAAGDSSAGDEFWNHERFSKVILMSESPLRRYYSFAAENLATALGCPREDAGEQLLCLRNARARDIVLATSERSRFFGPTQEPNVHLAAAVAGRRFLLGTVMGEGSHNLDIVARKPGNLQQNLIEFLQTVHHINHSTELAEVYRNSDFLPDKGDSNSRWALELLGDVAYTCPLLRLGQALAVEGRNQVYGYVFDHKPSFTLFNESASSSRFAELDFVFGRPLDLSRKGTPEERELSRRMIDIWASFAHSGVLPTIGDKPWPMYSEGKIVHVRIGTTRLEEQQDFKKKDCSIVAAFDPAAGESPDSSSPSAAESNSTSTAEFNSTSTLKPISWPTPFSIDNALIFRIPRS
ncbi:acetylcholinesterase-like [Amblyomma americanum]